jgi:DNA polymerase-3 subunit delta
MPSKSAAPSAVLLWGEDGFVLREEAAEVLGGVQPVEVDAADWQGGETADLATPSLFGERRALLITDARALPEAARKELAAYLAAPSPDSLLVATATVGERSKPPVWLTKLFGAGEVRSVSVGRRDLPAWLAARAKSRGLQIEPRVPTALIDVIGEDPAELDQALEQLADAYPGRKVTVEMATSQFRGLGDQKVWDLCDKAFARDLSGAMRSLESLLAAREEPLMILGGIASRLRELIRVREMMDRVPARDLARAASLRFEWQAKPYRALASNYSPEQLTEIHSRIVRADRELKSGGSGDVVLAVVVTAIADGKAA